MLQDISQAVMNGLVGKYLWGAGNFFHFPLHLSSLKVNSSEQVEMSPVGLMRQMKKRIGVTMRMTS